ncbi:MAG TPA: tRNA pseudouridine(55) synthase TruB [Terriglobales bacterium]|jgi:tRNA pseudouridine55 synthase|nr:tRNA pseudouridine(55) synthase TruB [Terriglobales bacterium]
MNGVVIIDKPAGMTSHDVVNRVRRILQQPAVGHLGTLDPLATGVLPLVAGNLTRLAQFYTSCEKTYEGTIRLGFATDTYDSDGEATSAEQIVNVSLEEMRSLAGKFVGIIEQMPPPFSAKKIKGVPAYKLARRHQDVPLSLVQVEIKEFAVLALSGNIASFRARVASGTYMRSVAHDMGQKIGCGAHLASLRRTALGEFALGDAHTLDELKDAVEDGRAEEIFIHPRRLLPQLPCVTANDETTALIRNGRSVNLAELSQARQVKVFAGQRELIAIATRIAGTLFHPRIVLLTDTARPKDAVSS